MLIISGWCMNKPFGRPPLPQRLSHRQQHHPLLLPRQPRRSNSSVSTMQTMYNLQELCMSRVNKNNLSNIHKCTNIQTHKCTNAEIHKFTQKHLCILWALPSFQPSRGRLLYYFWDFEIVKELGDFVPLTRIIGGALCFGSTLLNPGPSEEDLQKQLKMTKASLMPKAIVTKSWGGWYRK